jgi:hypothetical protein
MRALRYARIFLGLVCLAGPVSAQVFYKSPVIPAPILSAPDPEFDPQLSGATLAEQKALLVWSLRQGLLLGALQCHSQYPTLLTTSNYNALLSNHAAELAAAFRTLAAYFMRTINPAKDAQAALDQFATRTTSAYSTVTNQPGFCNTAGQIGRAALVVPRGQLAAFAMTRLGALRASLKAGGEAQFDILQPDAPMPVAPLPSMARRCWSKKGVYNARKCGELGQAN